VAFFIFNLLKYIIMDTINRTYTLLIALIASCAISCQETDDFSSTSAIASAHPLASKAGLSMYESGGNAADAAVAAAFTLSVVEPSMSGIGGRLQAIVYDPIEGISGIDGSTQVPQNYDGRSNDREGYKTIGIPGVVAGLIKIHEEHGVLPLSEVMAPAISYARNGFKLLPGEAFRQQAAQTSITNYSGTRKHFLKSDGSNYQANELLVQQELADVLERISQEGRDGFYKGPVADSIVADFRRNSGYLTKEDLENYEAKTAEIVKGEYKDHNIYSLYLPSYGAITVNMLQILEHFDLEQEDPLSDIRITRHAISKAYSKRRAQKDSLEALLSKELAKSQAEEIINDLTTASVRLNSDPISWYSPQGHTSHLTAADKDGRIISLTQTIGPNMGSKVATESLGFLYAVTMGGYLGDYKPGDRANSHISPTLVLSENKPVIALGAAGGSRIVTAIVQTIKNHLDLKLPINKAVERARIYPDGDTLLLEAHPGLNIDPGILAQLDSLGIPFKLQKQQGYHGRINAISYDEQEGKWIGSSDPDWEGTVEILEH
jgi:gamma-glutamyltranspeptidase/glutathione hydrolase